MNLEKFDLNNIDINIRLEGVRAVRSAIDSGCLVCDIGENDVNNHIHTTYSFSPYSPSYAAVMAKLSGLITGGIMDHDSACGAIEYTKASEILGIYSTVGVECRVSMIGTKFDKSRTNNPDQVGVSYVALHGIPHQSLPMIEEYFKNVIQKRYIRSGKMVENINKLIKHTGICLDLEKDIVPLSMYKQGGTITERHILFALAKKIIGKCTKSGVIQFLENEIDIKLSNSVKKNLSDLANPYFEYDLLGALKSDMVQRFYIDATDECPNVRGIVELSKKAGAILAYAYLGDVSDSVTGDKKTQKFEDEYIDELFFELKELGFNAITYMPSRNTKMQLEKVQQLCTKFDFFEISGEDINTPRQKFICYAQRDSMFAHLQKSTFALIAHEKLASVDITKALFSKEAIQRYPVLQERIKVYDELLRKG